jgi:uncharacterized Zn ribbon protein
MSQTAQKVNMAAVCPNCSTESVTLDGGQMVCGNCRWESSVRMEVPQ